MKGPASWGEFETASPELVRLARSLFDETGLALLGTIRKDGFPRISPVEPLFFAGELYLGMMWQSYKEQDFQRDLRCMVMNTVHDRMLKDGEFKLADIAIEVTDADERKAWETAILEYLGIPMGDDNDEPYHLFKPKVFAFNRSDGSRNLAKDIVTTSDLPLRLGNLPEYILFGGIWSDGTTMWVVDYVVIHGTNGMDKRSAGSERATGKLFAYNLVDDPDTPENELGQRQADLGPHSALRQRLAAGLLVERDPERPVEFHW